MRKKSTRIISAALAAAMMLSVCPVSAFATYRQAEAEKAVAAYAAAQANDEENGGNIITPEDTESTTISSAGEWTVKGGIYKKRDPIVIEGTNVGDEVVLNIENDVTFNYARNGSMFNSSFVYIKSPCTLIVNGNHHTIEIAEAESDDDKNYGSVIETEYSFSDSDKKKITVNDCTVKSLSFVGTIDVSNTDLTLNDATVTSSATREAIRLSESDIKIGDGVKLGDNGYIEVDMSTIGFVGKDTSAYKNDKIHVYSQFYSDEQIQLTPKGNDNFSEMLQLVDSDGQERKDYTIKYNSTEKYNYVEKVSETGGSQTSAELELDGNGYPTESKGGRKSVEHDNWVYNADGETLFLLDGTFSLNCDNNELSAIYVGFDDENKTVTLKDSNLSGEYSLIVGTNGIVENGIYNCDALTNKGEINSGSFNARLVENHGTIRSGDFTVRQNVNSALTNTGTISGGTFNCISITNRGTINNGVFTGDRFETFGTINDGTFKAAEITYNKGTISGGVFLFPEKPNDAAAKIALTDADNLTVNGLTLPAGQNSFYVMANGGETVVLGVPEGYPKPTAWKLTVGGKSLTIREGACWFRAGLDADLEPNLGLESADAERSDGTLILKVTDSSLLSDKLTVSANKPAAKAENYTIEMDGRELTADGSSLAYDAGAARKITVTRKATDDAAAAELTADQFTTTITRDGEPVDSIGLPGEYKVTVSIHDGAASGELTGYTFTIEKAEVDEAAMKVLLENFWFNIGDKFSYPNFDSPSSTINPKALLSAGFGTDISCTGYQKQQADGTWGDIIKEDPVKDPGTYAPVYTVAEGSVYQSVTLTYKDYCNSEKIQNKTFTVVAGRVYKDDFEPGKTIGETNPTYVDQDKLGKLHIVYYAQDGKTVVSTDTAPTELGTYKVGFRYDASEYYEALDYGPVSGWTYEVKETPTADRFEVKVDADTTYTGAPIGAEVTINGSTDGITVKYKDEDGKVTAEEPTKVGTYTVLIDYAGSDKYEAVENLEVSKFTIEPKELAPDDFTYDKEADEVKLTSPIAGVTVKTVYKKSGDDETAYIRDYYGYLRDPNTEEYAPAGEYEVWAQVSDANGFIKKDTIKVPDAAVTVDKYPIEFRDVALNDYAYDGTTHGISGSWISYDGLEEPNFTFRFYEYGTNKEVDEPTDAGKYYFTITSDGNHDYEPATYGGADNKDLTAFEITKRTEPVTADEIIFDGSKLTDEQKAQLRAKLPVEKAAEILKNAITTENGISKDDLVFTFYDKDGNEVTDFIRKKGAYTFKIKVKDSENYEGSADELTGTGWTFNVTAEPQSISPVYPEPSTTIPEDIASRFSWTAKDDTAESLEQNADGLFNATVGTSVTLNWTELDAEYSITGLTAVYTEDGVEKTVEGTVDKDNKTFTFEMPDAPVTIQVSVNDSTPVGPIDPGTDEPINPEPDFPGEVGDDEGFGAAVAVVAGGAAIGGAAYLLGTQIYLESVLPAGAAIPHTRAQLAQLLWTSAGKPVPKAVLADTSDAATALAWCVESGLLPAEGKSESYVTRVQVIKAWNTAKDKGLVK